MNTSIRSQRALLIIAIVSATLFGYGYCVLTGMFPPVSPRLNATEVADLYLNNNGRMRLGVVICLIAAGFNIPWSVVVSAQMARHEPGVPVWAHVQLIAGSLGALLFMLPVLFWGVAAFSATRDPQLTLLMHELAWLTFVTPVTFFVLQSLSIVVICLRRQIADSLSPFPRWMGYLTVWMMLSAELGVIAQLFKSGPFAWNGIFTFWLPLLMFAVWFSLLNFLIFKALSRQQAAGG